MATANDNGEDEKLVKLLRKLDTTEKVVSGMLSLERLPQPVEKTVEKRLGQFEEMIADIPSGKIQLIEEWNDRLAQLWTKFAACDRASEAASSSSAKLSQKQVQPTPASKSISPFGSPSPSTKRYASRVVEPTPRKKTPLLTYQPQSSSSNTILNSDSRNCYTCGLSGHFARDCPTKYQMKDIFDPTVVASSSAQSENEKTLKRLLLELETLEQVVIKSLNTFPNSVTTLEDNISMMVDLVGRIPPVYSSEIERWNVKVANLMERIVMSTSISHEHDTTNKERELFTLKSAIEGMLSVRPLPVEKLDETFMELLDSIYAIPSHCVDACNLWNNNVSILYEEYGILKENPNSYVSSTVPKLSPAEVSNAKALKLDYSLDHHETVEKKEVFPIVWEELVDILDNLKSTIENFFDMDPPPMDCLGEVLSQLAKATNRIPSELPDLVDEWTANLARFRQRLSGMPEELNKREIKKNLPTKLMEDLTQELNTLSTVIGKLLAMKPLPIGALERNLAAMSEVVQRIPQEEANAVTRWTDKYHSLLKKLSLERRVVPEVPKMTRQQIESRLALVFAKVQSVINDRDVVALKGLVQFAAKARRITQELTNHVEQYALQETVFGWIKYKLPENVLEAYLNQNGTGRKKYLHSLIDYLSKRVMAHFAELNGNDQQQQRQHVLCLNCFEYGHEQKFCRNASASVGQLLHI